MLNTHDKRVGGADPKRPPAREQTPLPYHNALPGSGWDAHAIIHRWRRDPTTTSAEASQGATLMLARSVMEGPFAVSRLCRRLAGKARAELAARAGAGATGAADLAAAAARLYLLGSRFVVGTGTYRDLTEIAGLLRLIARDLEGGAEE